MFLEHKRKFLISFTHEDHLRAIRQSVRYDPRGDGNCQFATIADQLPILRIHMSPDTLRAEIVRDFLRNPYSAAGVHLLEYVDNNDWLRYTNAMRNEGTYGDHITPQRAAELNNI